MYRTRENYKNTEERGEKLEKVSLTVPDESYTVRQLIERYTTGQLPPIYMQGTYEENPDIDREDPLLSYDIDLADATEESIELHKRDKVIQDNIRKKEKIKEENERKKHAEYEAWKKSQAETEPQEPQS